MPPFRARISRKQPNLPRFVVVPAELVADRTGPFTATLNGGLPLQRNIRPWDKEQDITFFNLTAPQCAKSTADSCDLCDITPDPI